MEDKRYKTRLRGNYWAGISSCPECSCEIDNICEDTRGFAHSNIGEVVIMECPDCFEFWYFHARPSLKQTIIRYLDLDGNKHLSVQNQLKNR